MAIMLDSGWSIVTSEETQGSLFLGVASGKIYMRQASSGDSMVVNYRCVSVGAGKGPPVGVSWSKKTDPSGGIDNVAVMPGRYFDSLSFPCRGYMIGVGASSGVVGSALGMNINGGGVTMAIFGMWPVFAGAKLWGMSNAALPGAGMNVGLAHYWVD